MVPEIATIMQLWHVPDLDNATEFFGTSQKASAAALADIWADMRFAHARLSPRSMPPLPHSRLFAVSPRSSSSPELDSPLEEAVEELINATCNLEDVQACTHPLLSGCPRTCILQCPENCFSREG